MTQLPTRRHLHIHPHNASLWIDRMSGIADRLRNEGQRVLAAHLDLMTAVVEDCVDDDWHDEQGRKVERFEWTYTGTPGDERFEFDMALLPVRRAA